MNDAAPTLPLQWPGAAPVAAPPGPNAGPPRRRRGRPKPDVGPRTVDVEPSDDVIDTGADTPTDAAGVRFDQPEVEVRTSSRRRKTATAFWEGSRIVVVVPAHLRGADRTQMVDWLVARVLAKRPRAGISDDALADRAADLADRYVDGVRPTSIRWVTNQGKRWGSCTTQTGEIRISHRLRAVPEWVLDATIVHELAHLLHADHSARFHQVADRYPRQREAALFLEGYSLGLGATTPVAPA